MRMGGYAPAEVRSMTFWEFSVLNEQWITDNSGPEKPEPPSLEEFEADVARMRAEEGQ